MGRGFRAKSYRPFVAVILDPGMFVAGNAVVRTFVVNERDFSSSESVIAESALPTLVAAVVRWFSPEVDAAVGDETAVESTEVDSWSEDTDDTIKMGLPWTSWSYRRGG